MTGKLTRPAHGALRLVRDSGSGGRRGVFARTGGGGRGAGCLRALAAALCSDLAWKSTATLLYHETSPAGFRD